eukprot:995911-Rhodomonas_salina.2
MLRVRFLIEAGRNDGKVRVEAWAAEESALYCFTLFLFVRLIYPVTTRVRGTGTQGRFPLPGVPGTRLSAPILYHESGLSTGVTNSNKWLATGISPRAAESHAASSATLKTLVCGQEFFGRTPGMPGQRSIVCAEMWTQFEGSRTEDCEMNNPVVINT